MNRFILLLTLGMVCITGSSTNVLAHTKPPQIIPKTITNQSIARTLQSYLNAFNVDNLGKAYSMFADIKQHQTLKQFKAQGDPQKGWRPILTSVYVIEKENIAEAYAKMSIMNHTQKPNFLFVYPLIKQNGTWKMVFDESDFGHQKFLLFKQINKEMNTYAQKHPLIG